ncbi:hypothetical protein KM043_008121 [Ampulex compressa]|nr:hypothetical protein KM043_008121 [Ampulex compressa]
MSFWINSELLESKDPIEFVQDIPRLGLPAAKDGGAKNVRAQAAIYYSISDPTWRWTDKGKTSKEKRARRPSSRGRSGRGGHREEKRIRSQPIPSQAAGMLALAKYWMATANIRPNYARTPESTPSARTRPALLQNP